MSDESTPQERIREFEAEMGVHQQSISDAKELILLCEQNIVKAYRDMFPVSSQVNVYTSDRSCPGIVVEHGLYEHMLDSVKVNIGLKPSVHERWFNYIDLEVVDDE